MPTKISVLRGAAPLGAALVGATLLLLLALFPAPVSAQSPVSLPHTYGFETAIDGSGWTVSGTDYAIFDRSDAVNRTGSYSMEVNTVIFGDYTPLSEYFRSPLLPVTSNPVKVEFYYKGSASAPGPYSFKVIYTDDDDPDASYSLYDEGDVVTVTGSEWQHYAGFVPAGSRYVALAFEQDGIENVVYIDDITISENTSCAVATGLAASSVSAHSVRLTWTDNSGGYATYKIKNGDDEVATAGRGETSCYVRGLTEETAYTLKLVTVCGDDELDTPPTVSFTTTKDHGRPLVKGYVCGGGRMADVGGSTRVTVGNCDHLYAVYGGNDIAGEVKGDTSHYTGVGAYTGTEVNIGTDGTDGTSMIDYVYGGGSGFYSYVFEGGTSHDVLSAGAERTPVTGSAVYNYDYDPEGCNDSFGTLPTGAKIPTVSNTRVTVNSDYVYIDSLFGGAENAYVKGSASDTNVSITINKGTVFSVFGGNNYGGYLTANTWQHITLNGTLTDENSSASLGGDALTGSSHTCNGSVSCLMKKTVTSTSVAAEPHGIRYLFGGGNHVDGQNVHIEVHGGQVDTLFAGGNQASVASAKVEVDVDRPLYDSYAYSYDEENSVYDIRCLFGGNNHANMAAVPDLVFTRGGIHTLYGGGNQGDMTGSQSYADNNDVYTGASASARRSTKIEVNSPFVVCDTIYGGGQSAGTAHDTYIHLSRGDFGTVYGGSNFEGNIGHVGSHDGLGRNASGVAEAKTNIHVDGSATIEESLFGGSNGFYMVPSADGKQYTAERTHPLTDAYDYLSTSGHYVPEVWQTDVWVSGGTFNGKIYGGGNMAVVGTLAASDATDAVKKQSEGTTKLLFTGGWMTADVYGGGNYASVFGNSDVLINGTDFYPWFDENVYGGNDKFGTVTGGPSRTGTTSTQCGTDVVWSTMPTYMTEDVDIANRRVDLTASNAASRVLVEGYPSFYKNIFGGGNGAYNYFTYNRDGEGNYVEDDGEADGLAKTFALDRNDDWDDVATFSNMFHPDQRSSFVDLHSDVGVGMQKVFGGGNNVTVGKDITINGVEIAMGKATVWLNSTDYDEEASYADVGRIYGGNNLAAMAAVPRVYLLKGIAREVYGGGDQGDMTGTTALTDGVSTEGHVDEYGFNSGTSVFMSGSEVDVLHAIYGGSNVADVTNGTFVGINRGKASGSIFGGNNVSGNVSSSHVMLLGEHDIAVGGEVFGGGKGDYVYSVNSASPEEGVYYWDVDYELFGIFDSYSRTTGRPYTTNTSVLVTGKVQMNGNIYGGGLAGGCDVTEVVIDAPEGRFNDMIFGGSKGDITQIGNKDTSFTGYTDGVERPHCGTVSSETNVHIKQMAAMSGSHRRAFFGGGYSGDVNGNTNVTLYNTNEASIPAVYLGGLAASVSGTATGLFNGYEPSGRANIVDTIYGGNDFTGLVNATSLTVNSGIYQHVFGAGNGDYDYATLLSGSGFTTLDTTPYSMSVNVVYNGGIFRGTVYGGGNMGLVGNRDMVSTDMEADDAGRYAHLGRIRVTINDGEFRRHVFGGARGKTKMKGRYFGTATGTHNNVEGSALGKQLVYGIKQVDMYGGTVLFSLHGGSEAVDDGYPFECLGPDSTNFYKNLADRVSYDISAASSNPQCPHSTMRPSSIVNLVGGHVRKSVYGGGYQGNIYGSVFVNIGTVAIDDSPVWTRYASMRIDGNNSNNIASLKPVADSLVPATLNLDASVYNCADWGEAGDKAYFNTRGVFGGETNIIIDGNGYNTTGEASVPGGKPEMDIAVNIIGAGTSTEGGDINRLIIMRNYGSYVCPKPVKSLYSIQRADKVVLDRVYLNIYGEQDAFESYATPNFTLNRLDTLVLCNDNVLNLESAANFIGLHASMKNIPDANIASVYRIYNINGSSPNLVTDVAVNTNGATEAIATAGEHLVSDDILDNQVDGDDCDSESGTGCDLLDVCALVPNNRGSEGRPGTYNTIILDNGSYMKVSPFVDVWDNRTIDLNDDGDTDDEYETPHRVRGGMTGDGLDDNEDDYEAPESTHPYGHVYGYTYLVAPVETMAYVYGIFKTSSVNNLDGGFVSPCTCNNIVDSLFPSATNRQEIGYTNVSSTGPYRTWRIGTTQGLRKRSATLIANKVPDQILNWPLATGNYTLRDNERNVTANGFNQQWSSLAYATAAIELPPAKDGNFYIIDKVEIDQANGAEMHLIDQGYEAVTNSVFQSFGTASSNLDLASIVGGDQDVRNFTFGLTMSTVAPTSVSGRVTNYSDYNTVWTGTTPEGAAHPVYDIQTPNGLIRRDIAVYDYTSGSRSENPISPVTYHKLWPITSISGSEYMNSIGGYISNDVESPIPGATEGIIPRVSLTLTYDTRINTTIARDVKFRMLEYDKHGEYVGPIDITVTIVTVIRDFEDLDAAVLAMYNEGISDEYVRRVNIPAAFLQRDLYLEDVKWERNTDISADHFHLQDMESAISDNSHFAIQVRPVEMVSNTLNNHMGWYDIVEENDTIDLYALAQEDYVNRSLGVSLSDAHSVNYTSWHSDPTTPYDAESLETIEEHYNGTMPSYAHLTTLKAANTWGDNTASEWYDDRIDATSLHGNEGIKLGTLDGRAPATLDISLKYDGNLVYPNHFNDGDPGPLAWAYLKLHWYNNNEEKDGEDNDGIFWVKIKVRTREKGDTIYMAPGNTLVRRTAESQQCTVSYWNHPDSARVGSVEAFADKIRNNPDMYVKNFGEAMRIYQEGDVLDIMETITIDGGDPISLGSNDYGGIQVIRYSGSHFKFPSLGCANPHVMVRVSENGRLALRNVQFNGSGATRVKERSDTRDGTLGVTSTQSGSYYYNASANRVRALYFAEAPILHTDAGGQLYFNDKVSLLNNFSKAKLSDGDTCGGAMAVTNGGIVNMGNGTRIYDNLVVEQNAAAPDNYGGAVYVNSGLLRVGPQVEDAECIIEALHNYYYKNALSSTLSGVVNQDIAASPIAGFGTDTVLSIEGTKHPVYRLDTAASGSLASTFSLSNVYLTRTPNTVTSSQVTAPEGLTASRAAEILNVRTDGQGDRIQFTGVVSEGSRIGVSKWFPGYPYTSSGSSARLDNDVPRDTVSIAVLMGSVQASIAEKNYSNDVFFDDSNYFAQSSGDLSFAMSGNLTTYKDNSTDFPSYTDRVYPFYHNYVDANTIYLQRCASFGKGVTQQKLLYNTGSGDVVCNDYKLGDSISFHWNPDATCEVITDSLFFHVGGGFFPYTYHWDYDEIVSTAGNTYTVTQNAVRDRNTVDPNSISNLDVTSYAAKRAASQCVTLVLRSLVPKPGLSNYLFRVTADDLSGRCAVSMPIMIHVGKTTTAGDPRGDGRSYYADDNNFLRHKNPEASYPSDLKYRVRAAGVDSSSFHDHVRFTNDGGTLKFYTADGTVVPYALDGSSILRFNSNIANNEVERHVPIYTHSDNVDDPETGTHAGIRRAGFTNNDGMNYSTGNNSGTLAQQAQAWTFTGRPYADASHAITVSYVLEDGTTPDPSAPATNTYASEMVPRYMRVYQSFQVVPQIEPAEAWLNDGGTYPGHVWIYADGETTFDEAHQIDQSAGLCPGTLVLLRPQPETRTVPSPNTGNPAFAEWDYMYWDFDPSATENTAFVVGKSNDANAPTVYYSPKQYWWQVVNQYNGYSTDPSDSPNIATRFDYDFDYQGNVTIYSRKGLAWLISTVNGYNGQNANPFHFNSITFDFTNDDEYGGMEGTVDMGRYRWTPVGNLNNPFSGHVVGSNGVVKNLIVNEPDLSQVAMFGYTHKAHLENFHLNNVVMKGSNYVGSLVAQSNTDTITGIITDGNNLLGEYVVGGLVARADSNTLIDKADVGDWGNDGSVRMIGNAIYAGGLVGQMAGSTITNSSVHGIDYKDLSTIYFGGIAGTTELAQTGAGAQKPIIHNNLVHIENPSIGSQRTGGLVGRAMAIDLVNDYVYGDMAGIDVIGSYIAYASPTAGAANMVDSNLFFNVEVVDTNQTGNDEPTHGVAGIGMNNGGYVVHNSSSFSGYGNHVTLSQSVGGINNLTRVLNRWVNEHPGEGYLHWRSSLDGRNHGFPVFGQPDLIPINESLDTAVCGELEWDGLTLTNSDVYIFHVTDSLEGIDSTFTLTLTVNYGDTVEVSDTVQLGQPYEGYGISLTADEVQEAFGSDMGADIRTLMHIDSLLNATGCDSLVILTLYIVNNNTGIGSQLPALSADVKIYPNPTRSMVTVEGSGLISVEVYDNISRHVTTINTSTAQQINTSTPQHLSFDLPNHPAGAYYVRVRTAFGTVVKKVIKK